MGNSTRQEEEGIQRLAEFTYEDLRAELARRRLIAERRLVRAWLDQEDHVLPNERTGLCIGGCHWGTDDRFHHHPYCKLVASLREPEFYCPGWTKKESR